MGASAQDSQQPAPSEGGEMDGHIDASVLTTIQIGEDLTVHRPAELSQEPSEQLITAANLRAHLADPDENYPSDNFDYNYSPSPHSSAPPSPLVPHPKRMKMEMPDADDDDDNDDDVNIQSAGERVNVNLPPTVTRITEVVQERPTQITSPPPPPPTPRQAKKPAAKGQTKKTASTSKQGTAGAVRAGRGMQTVPPTSTVPPTQPPPAAAPPQNNTQGNYTFLDCHVLSYYNLHHLNANNVNSFTQHINDGNLSLYNAQLLSKCIKSIII